MSDFDAILIGAGHNGLTCAAYLGMAGLRVRIEDPRQKLGRLRNGGVSTAGDPFQENRHSNPDS
jgi:thioredoxin reductase